MRMIDFIKEKGLYEEWLMKKEEIETERGRRRYMENKESMKEYQKKWREKNKEHLAKYWKSRHKSQYLKKWPKEKVLNMVDLHNQWLSQVEIAEMLWCTKQNVNTSLKLYFKKYPKS